MKEFRNRWRSRIHRMQRNISQDGADLLRSISWYFGGGNRFFERFSSELVTAHNWCFIVGCNNSGTSLLQSALETTGQVSTMPAEGQRFTNVLRRAERKGHERVWFEYVQDLALSADDSRDRVPRLLHDWFAALESPVRKVILEKTPANVARMEWLQLAFPHCYFIGLVRNGYAVSEGIRRKGHKSLERSAKHWDQVNRLMLSNSGKVNNFMEVRYEDLVERHHETMRKILSFLGLPIATRSGETGELPSVREDHRELRNFNAESIARLTDEECRIIYQNAHTMLDHFNYSSTRPNL